MIVILHRINYVVKKNPHLHTHKWYTHAYRHIQADTYTKQNKQKRKKKHLAIYTKIDRNVTLFQIF